jgi:hypothetical protein
MSDLILPDWQAPANVRALSTTRAGGASQGSYASLNLGDHVGDDAAAVAENRARLRAVVPAEPMWLKQVHGTRCVVAADSPMGVEADASVSFSAGSVCAVLTADCLPLLLCDTAGTAVAAAHAGWRGLAAGVIERTVRAMQRPGSELLAWLGPAIGPASFEVGDEVRAAFVAHDAQAVTAFAPQGDGKWLCDLYTLARQRLVALGVQRISGGGYCTYTERERFYSFRRDGVTGRMASCIWLEAPARS